MAIIMVAADGEGVTGNKGGNGVRFTSREAGSEPDPVTIRLASHRGADRPGVSVDKVIEWLEFANNIGLWSLLAFGFGAIGAVTAAVIISRRRYDRFSLFPSYRIGTGHSLYPNVIYFSARNLGDSPLVICRPNFRPGKHLRVDDSAHGNLDTNDYEIKFRPLTPDYKVVPGNSYTTFMLRHRESALAYLPIDRSYTEETFGALDGQPLGIISFDIVTVSDSKPKVVRIRQTLRKVAAEHYEFELGRDPAKAKN